MIRVINVDPAGNITAIVRGSVKAEHRISIAQNIMSEDPEVEQAGFEVPPVMGGDCRLEMMGGEFCGNATRAFAYLTLKERCASDPHLKDSVKKENSISVEISGANAPVQVRVNLEEQSAYTDMPLPTGVEYIPFLPEQTSCTNNSKSMHMSAQDALETKQMCSVTFPLVKMDGIAHVVLEHVKANQEMALELLKHLRQNYSEDAYGILFLDDQPDKLVMIPLVYVCQTETMVWESSCGSGTTACTWYLIRRHLADKNDGNYSFTFQEPGGILKTDVEIKDHQITHIWMGGSVQIGESREMRGYYEVL